MSTGGYPPNRQQNRRWYDRIGQVTMAIHLSAHLPPEIQMMVASHLELMIEEHMERERAKRGVLSIGQERVMGLHKASAGGRWYDSQQLPFRRSYNRLCFLPDRMLEGYSERVIDVVRHVAGSQDGRLYYNPYDLAVQVTDLLKPLTERSPRPVIIMDGETGFRITGES
ncbi:MAG: hypothetical protein AB7P76_00070 [Candidatus Melainabacteria bacterium]